MKKLKVFALAVFRDGNQVSAIVATTTQKKAIDHFKTTYSNMKGYGTISRNKDHLDVALKEPDTVFMQRLTDHGNNYVSESEYLSNIKT